MQWLVDFGLWIWDWFGVTDNQNRVGAITAAVGTILAVLSIPAGLLWFFWGKLFPQQKTIIPAPVVSPALPSGDVLSVNQHLTLLQKREDRLKAELAQAHVEEKTLLLNQIADLESQIANPDQSLAAEQKRIANLEDLLDRSGNNIGGDRINAAKAALEQRDYSLADDIFAEIEARNDLAVQESARASFGRGEVAEAEVRWADAADHYVASAKRHETYGSLLKASEFLWRAGRYADAFRYSTDLVAFAKAHEPQERIAAALNENALHLKTMLQYAEAEALYREALDIARATIGEGHPNYATGLNNLALVVKAQGRLAEAETLYRQALEIGRATIGEGHPSYAMHLNNLASVLEAQGRLAEAEALYRQAIEIDRATIGEGHPNYAIHLNNLAGLLVKLDRVAEARPLFAQALAIWQATLPADHPNIATVESHIANLPAANPPSTA